MIIPFPEDDESAARHRREYGRMITQDLLENNIDIADCLNSSDSDQDHQPPCKKQRIPNKERNHLEHHSKLMADYFNEDSTYNGRDFCQRFRMEKGLFLRILDDLTSHYPYLVQKAVSCAF